MRVSMVPQAAPSIAIAVLGAPAVRQVTVDEAAGLRKMRVLEKVPGRLTGAKDSRSRSGPNV